MSNINISSDAASRRKDDGCTSICLNRRLLLGVVSVVAVVLFAVLNNNSGSSNNKNACAQELAAIKSSLEKSKLAQQDASEKLAALEVTSAQEKKAARDKIAALEKAAAEEKKAASEALVAATSKVAETTARETKIDPSTDAASSSSFRTLEEQVEWIKNDFKAADESHQEWCVKALLGTGPGAAQFDQDTFVARNLFLEHAMDSKKGFYVEAGANHYKFQSSTYFYDKCLGWDGLCVEPQVAYHADLKEHRSCTLVPKCLMSKITDMMIATTESAGNVIKPLVDPLPDNMQKVECGPLSDFVKEVQGGDAAPHVDLFVLDVEGAERIVLDSIDWTKLTFDALLIEDNKLFGRRLDYDLNMLGYAKFHQLAIDSLFVPRSKDHRKELWYPPGWKKHENLCEMKGSCRPDCPKAAPK